MKVKRIQATKPALQQMLNGLKWSRNTREEKLLQNQPQTIKKMVTGTYISIITLNVNRLNAPTKRYRLAGWLKKIRPIYMLSTRNPLQTSRHI